jgi:hypothetical protein
MAISYSKLFEPTVLTTSAATLGSAIPSTPTSSLLRGGRVRFTNTSAVAVTVTAYAVPSGGAAADGNAIIKAKSIAANDYLDIDLPAMKAGDFLQALASAATSITAHYITGSIFS